MILTTSVCLTGSPGKGRVLFSLYVSSLCVYATCGGGNQIFVRLGGEVFGWELKFHEIFLGGNQPRMPLWKFIFLVLPSACCVEPVLPTLGNAS